MQSKTQVENALQVLAETYAPACADQIALLQTIINDDIVQNYAEISQHLADIFVAAEDGATQQEIRNLLDELIDTTRQRIELLPANDNGEVQERLQACETRIEECIKIIKYQQDTIQRQAAQISLLQNQGEAIRSIQRVTIALDDKIQRCSGKVQQFDERLSGVAQLSDSVLVHTQNIEDLSQSLQLLRSDQLQQETLLCDMQVHMPKTKQPVVESSQTTSKSQRLQEPTQLLELKDDVKDMKKTLQAQQKQIAQLQAFRQEFNAEEIRKLRQQVDFALSEIAKLRLIHGASSLRPQ